jgi:hypothetical protein
MAFVSNITGPWGLLPLAVPLAWIVVARLGVLGFADLSAPERLLGGATWAVATFVASVRLLGAVRALFPLALFGSLALLAGGLAAVRPLASLALPWRKALTRTALPPLLVAGLALGIAVAAAIWMPVWQWDALGYHLPFVDFALQERSFAGVPKDVPYLSTYPHDVELCFLAFRAMLPDDRLVELAHVPFGLLGAAATTAFAKHAGARDDDAVIAGSLWLTVPAVFLQLPTNYIDVACAAFLLVASYWVLAMPTARTITSAGVALGLYLGSKPNAPVATALLFAVLAWRSWRGGHARWTVVAGLLILALGAESYFDNLLRHHNPIRPVRVRIGSWEWPGTTWMHNLLEAGALAPRTHGPLPWRLLVSWTSLSATPMFDMRVGGFGPLFPVALAISLTRIVRERAWVYLAPATAALASPDPAVARYVLAFPALVMALSARSLGRLGPHARGVALAAVTGCAAWSVAYAMPGLAGEGPPLLAYAHMTDTERVRAVGADGPPSEVIAARDRLHPAQAAAYDRAFDLPYLAWTPDLSTRVVRVPDGADVAALERLVQDEDVHLLLVGEDQVAGLFARSHPERFVPLFSLSACKSTRCAAYYRP